MATLGSEGTIAERYAAAAASAASYSAAFILQDVTRDTPATADDVRVVSFRSVRNVTTDAAESYLQWHSASSAAAAIQPMTPPFPVSHTACNYRTCSSV